jgi:hypothetical protein
MATLLRVFVALAVASCVLAGVSVALSVHGNTV